MARPRPLHRSMPHMFLTLALALAGSLLLPLAARAQVTPVINLDRPDYVAGQTVVFTPTDTINFNSVSTLVNVRTLSKTLTLAGILISALPVFPIRHASFRF